MTYKQALDWMFLQLPMYQRQGATAFKKDLTNILAFLKQLDFPEKQFKSIHVGGTNGKGSTSHMIASILQEAGYKVGLYTSPHLKNFTERIRINGKEIPKRKVSEFITTHKDFLEKQQLSFFEMTVGMAFWFFANEKVDIAVVEVGLGGRLDSTNTITPEVSVITNIGLDHTQFLGNTLPEIASEKAGIIKRNIPVVIGERQIETQAIFIDKAKSCQSSIVFASDCNENYTTDLLGSYQQNNTKTAVTAIEQLTGFLISKENINKGLLNVVKNTNLQGRWQILQKKPKVICDTAHNKEGLYYVLKQLQKEVYEKLHIVLGVVADKNLDAILPMFPKNAQYYFCKPNIQRGLEALILQKEASKYKLEGMVFSSVKSALKNAKAQANQDDVVYVGGSTFVVAEIL
ncbi:folylpolyglutamate synthase/dihydrofolate synthase family protein [Tenacibaculum sp. UWU-22]|uniref:bifunctional folylpolyglutamate synthase/dihydrofolate synthase n=1 Tax=Tenacibaculum sp. UWU-22 TaxID=3234187 RepID=UPI0034DB5FA5